MKIQKIIYLPKDYYGYFGWPSIARAKHGLVMVCSGFRHFHTGPFGRVVYMESPNEGKDWSAPTVVMDGPSTDFRDPGVVWFHDHLMITGFSADTKTRCHEYVHLPKRDRALYWRGLIYHEAKKAHPWYSEYGQLRKTWLSSPHGPIVKNDGGMIYMGRCAKGIGVAEFAEDEHSDEWQKLAIVPVPSGDRQEHFQEPHIIQTGEKSFLGVIRYQREKSPLGYESEFSMWATHSNDGGRKWTKPTKMCDGSPPHLMRHSRGTIILTYGQRIRPYGIRVATSDDDGKSWRNEIVLWDKGISTDLGYPCSVELKDGRIQTIFYAALEEHDKCGILGCKWELPA